MSERILAFDYGAEITSECWTFYELAILKPQLWYAAWKVGKFDLFYFYNEKESEALFGKNLKQYNLTYHSDVLEIEGINAPTSAIVQNHGRYCEMSSGSTMPIIADTIKSETTIAYKTHNLFNLWQCARRGSRRCIS